MWTGKTGRKMGYACGLSLGHALLYVSRACPQEPDQQGRPPGCTKQVPQPAQPGRTPHTETREMVRTWEMEPRFKTRNMRNPCISSETLTEKGERWHGDYPRHECQGPADQKGEICSGCSPASVECLFITSALRLIL